MSFTHARASLACIGAGIFHYFTKACIFGNDMQLDTFLYVMRRFSFPTMRSQRNTLNATKAKDEHDTLLILNETTKIFVTSSLFLSLALSPSCSGGE